MKLQAGYEDKWKNFKEGSVIMWFHFWKTTLAAVLRADWYREMEEGKAIL